MTSEFPLAGKHQISIDFTFGRYPGISKTLTNNIILYTLEDHNLRIKVPITYWTSFPAVSIEFYVFLVFPEDHLIEIEHTVTTKSADRMGFTNLVVDSNKVIV